MAASGPPYLPFGAYAPPSMLRPAPPPTWTSTFELPTARRVVSAGLQLAFSSTREVRRGSIYIGLLMLGALAPVLAIVLASVLGAAPELGRLLGLVFANPSFLLDIDPNLAELALTIDAAFLLAAILLIAISIDANAIAITLLAGRATGRPLRVWEAIARARSVFWRLAGAGLLVGIPAAIVSFVVSAWLNSRGQNPEGASIVAQLVSTLLLAPLAYMGAGIVIGDVGIIESAKRSVKLFRARTRIGLVVVLFPLVASAIQIFAIGAGVDVVARIAEALHLDALTGGVGAAVGIGLVVLAVVALGSLIFTMSALVAAPQVAAFLGLTLYAGGVESVRRDGERPPGVRWISRPMLATIGVATPLLASMVVGFGSAIPELPDFLGPAQGGPPPGASVLRPFLGDLAVEHGQFVIVSDDPFTFEDAAGDQAGAADPATDLVYGEFALLPSVPTWLLAEFDCDLDAVACSDPTTSPSTYSDGALAVAVEVGSPPGGFEAGRRREWGVVFALTAEATVPIDPDDPLSDASHAIVVRTDGGEMVVETRAFEDGSVDVRRTRTRAMWRDGVLILLVPVVGEIQKRPVFWDVYARLSTDSGAVLTTDSTRRTSDGRGLWGYVPPPPVYFESR